MQAEPGKQGLEASISAAPAVVIEVLIAIVEVFIQASSVVLYVLVLLHSFDEEMRVVQFLRREGDQLSRRVGFAIVELFDQSICCFVDLLFASVFCVDVQVEG